MSNTITNIRENIAKLKLEYKIKKTPHKPTIYNLKTAKTAGILYDATLKEDFLIARELVKELKEFGIQSNALGFINKSKRDDNYIGDQTYNFTYKKDFSFLYSINNDSVQKFVDTHFNILFILINKEIFEINYLGLLSKADFKVGSSAIDNKMLDLIIELKENNDIKELKNQIIHYLNILNNNQAK